MKVARTPLHYAAMNGHVDIVYIMLDVADYVDIKDNVKKTPLHYAAENGNADIVFALIKAGVNMHTKDKVFACNLRLRRSI